MTRGMLLKLRKLVKISCGRRLWTYAFVISVLICVRYVTREHTNLFRSDSVRSEIASRRTRFHEERSARYRWNGVPHLAVTICGTRLEEPLTMLKSAALFTKTFLIIHVFADSAWLRYRVKTEFESWPLEYRGKIEYFLYNASFPAEKPCENCEWKDLFAPCAAQRLFLADILKDVDSILYVDADTLFLAPIGEIWQVLHNFNKTQFVGAVPVTEIPETGMYFDTSNNIPFYGPTGINSGVLLMNLTRIRTVPWLPRLAKTFMQYKEQMTTGDQDLINVYLHNHPENGYLLDCDWNYRLQQCKKCIQASQRGVAIIHGFLKTFTSNNAVPFRIIYNAFKEHKLMIHTIKHDLLQKIARALRSVSPRHSVIPNICHIDSTRYTRRIQDFVTHG